MNQSQRHIISEKIYNLILQYPTKSDNALSKDLNLSNKTVTKYRKKLYVGLDHHLARNISGKFLTHFQMASDYFMKQLERLEELKKDESLNPMDILQIEKQQTVLWEKIIFLCRQSEAVEVIKMMQNGELPVINQ